MNIAPGNQNSQSSLFRKAAIDAQKSAWLGHPKLIQPISVLTATVMALAIMTLIGSFLFWGEYTRRVRVYGSVVPSAGVIQVFAPQSGRIYRNFSGDDQPVTAGMPLFTLRSDTTTGLGETEFVVKQQLQERIADLQETIDRRTDLAQVEKRGLSERLLSVNNEIARVDAQLEQTTDYLAVLLPRVEKYRALVDRGVTTERNFEIAEQAYMQSRQELESLRRQRVQLSGSGVEIQTKLNGFDASVSIEIAELRQRIATLKEQMAQAEARREIIITAPANGSIAATLAHSGQPVAVGAPLISILPEGEDLEIHFLADSKAIGFAREGAPVLLRYIAFPYQKFGQYGGEVVRVSRVTVKQSETETDAFAAQPQPVQQRYRITVKPDQPFVKAYGKKEHLRAGMSVEADLLLDSRPLYQWLLEPFYSLHGRSSVRIEEPAT